MSRKKGAAAPMTMDQVREATLIAERIEALRAAGARLDDLVAPDALVEAVLHDGDRSMALPKLPASTYAEFLTQGAARLVAQLRKMGVEPPEPASLPLQGGGRLMLNASDLPRVQGLLADLRGACGQILALDASAEAGETGPVHFRAQHGLAELHLVMPAEELRARLTTQGRQVQVQLHGLGVRDEQADAVLGPVRGAKPRKGAA